MKIKLLLCILLFANSAGAAHVNDRAPYMTDVKAGPTDLSVFSFPLVHPTASRVCTFNSDGEAVSSSVTDTTLTYLDIGSSLTTLLAGKETSGAAAAAQAFSIQRANHTGTQLANTVSNFQATVSANTDVAANTAARHSSVTIGTANGLSLSTQALSLAAATDSVPGALTAADHATFAAKQAGPLTGDVTTSGAAATLANTAVTAGSYTNSNITVDAKGRITAAANGSAGGVTSVTGTAPISSSGGATPAISIANAQADGSTKGAASFAAADFNAASGVISLDYANAQAASASLKGFLTSADWSTFNSKVSANGAITGATKTKITYDSKGLVTAGADIGASDLPTGIDAAKIADGSVSNAEFQSLNTVTSNIQDQIDAAVANAVPYSGAVSDVNLGSNSLSAYGINIQDRSTSGTGVLYYSYGAFQLTDGSNLVPVNTSALHLSDASMGGTGSVYLDAGNYYFKDSAGLDAATLLVYGVTATNLKGTQLSLFDATQLAYAYITLDNGLYTLLDSTATLAGLKTAGLYTGGGGLAYDVPNNQIKYLSSFGTAYDVEPGVFNDQGGNAAIKFGASGTRGLHGNDGEKVVDFNLPGYSATPLSLIFNGVVRYAWDSGNQYYPSGNIFSDGSNGVLYGEDSGASTARIAIYGAQNDLLDASSNAVFSWKTTGEISWFGSTPTGQQSGDLLAGLQTYGLFGGGSYALSSVSGLGTNVATWLSTPSSANLRAAITDETGTGSAVFAAQPTFTTDITAPKVIGGTGTTSTLTLQTTSGVGTTNADLIIKTGNNGATEAARIINSGKIGLGVTPIVANMTKDVNIFGVAGFESSASSGTGTLQIWGKNAGTRVSDGYITGFANTGGMDIGSENSVLRLITSGSDMIFMTNAGGQELARFSNASSYNFGVGTGSTVSARLHAKGSDAAMPVEIVQAAASQSASMTEWRNSSATALTKVLSDGRIMAPSGSDSNAAFGFLSDASIGMYLRSGVPTLGYGGGPLIQWDNTGVRLRSSNVTGVALDTGLGSLTGTWGTTSSFGVGIAGSSLSGDCQLDVEPTTTARIGMKIQLLASQSGNAITVKNGSGTVISAISPTGHVITGGTAPTVSACGVSPSISGNDTAGAVTVGTGGLVSSCTLTFATAYTAAPHCFLNDQTELVQVAATATTTVLTISKTTPFAASSVIDYHCIQ